MRQHVVVFALLVCAHGLSFKRKLTGIHQDKKPAKNEEREDISVINMKHGILSDVKYKNGNKRGIPTLWKNNLGQPRVPYVLDMAKDYKAVILKAISMMNSYMKSYSCVNNPPVWVPRTNEKDYVIFTSKYYGCTSGFGRGGGDQDLNIGDGCQYTGTILHEMLHVLGFEHEHNRCDRNTAVEIIYSNINDGEANQFDIKYDRTTFPSKYDIWSVMQYPLWALSKKFDETEEAKTIKVKKQFLSLTRDQEEKVGFRDDLSEADKLELAIMYGCAVSSCKVGCDGILKC